MSALVVLLIVSVTVIIDLALLLVKGKHGLPLAITFTGGTLYGGVSIYYALRD